MDYQKLFESGVNQESVKAWRASGKKAIGYLCCHIPVEIFYALDVLPVRLRATGCTESPDADTWMSSFSCSYARGLLQYWMNGTYELDGLVTSDGCMMTARAFDNAEYQDVHVTKAKKFFKEIGAPRMYKGDLEIGYYVDEIGDLIAGLEEYTGNKMTDEKLKAAIDKMNEARALVRKVYELRKADHPVINGEDCLKITMAFCDYPLDEYIEMLKAFLADAGNRKPITDGRARLMIIGSALDNPGYLKVIEDKGGLFVMDSLCYGNRPFNSNLEIKNNNLIASIAEYYLDRIVCPRMLDNRIKLQNQIVEDCKNYKIDGVVYEKMQYCECWGGEIMFLEPALKEIGVPVLQVEREEHLANAGQLAIRAEAFVEMIEK
ncbi:MAG: 2-hydroxyacyl-CoA dehydratase family protein [Oscillospiraceae bacterium]